MITAAALLSRAAEAFDRDPAHERDARAVALAGFGGGLAWMCGRVGTSVPSDPSRLRRRGHVLGILKYGLCVLFAAWVSALMVIGLSSFVPGILLTPLVGIAFVLSFYALEARWVFVFPAMAHGEPRPFARSWSMTGSHGGTLAAMRVVMPIASWMLFGGLRDGRMVRAWVTGCHAVLLWYEELAGHRRTS